MSGTIWRLVCKAVKLESAFFFRLPSSSWLSQEAGIPQKGIEVVDTWPTNAASPIKRLGKSLSFVITQSVDLLNY